MEFFIKKNATLPLLKLQVVKDGRSDYNNFMKLIEVASLYFSMVDTETGIPKFTSRPAGFVEKTFDDPNAEPEYYIYYQFSSQDTRDEGRYEGQFMLRSSEGVLILPVREKLFINIQESFIADDLEYVNCYTSDFPCCVDFPTNSICPPCPSFVPSPTPTITPSLTPNLQIGLSLFSVITPGSIVVTYNLVSTMSVMTTITVEFSHVLETNGSPIIITTGITLNQGSTSNFLEITLPDDFGILTQQSYFSQILINPSQLSIFFTINETIVFKVTPTPTMTQTPTPTPTITESPTPTPTITVSPTIQCVQFITDELGNFILTENGDFIISDVNPCISSTPTPTPTQTPTQFVQPVPPNDFTNEILPNNDLYYQILNLQPIINDFQYFVIPNNDLNYNILNQTILYDFNYILIPNNDFEYNILNDPCFGNPTYTLITLPYEPPSQGKTIFPGFTTTAPTGTTNPNTFDVDGIYWNIIDNKSIDRYPYFSNLESPFVISFSQNGNTAIYSGETGSIEFIVAPFPPFDGVFYHDYISNPGQLPLTLLQSSPVDFTEGQDVCISFYNISNVTPTPTPTPTSIPQFYVINCGISHTYNSDPASDWNGYGDNYLQVGPSQEGDGTVPPQAWWYFVDEFGTVRQITDSPVWFSGGAPSPYPNGIGWLCVSDGPFVLNSGITTSLTFCESQPTVIFGPPPSPTPTPTPSQTPSPTCYTVRQYLYGYDPLNGNGGLYVLDADYPNVGDIPLGATATINGTPVTVTYNIPDNSPYFQGNPGHYIDFNPPAGNIAAGTFIEFCWFA